MADRAGFHAYRQRRQDFRARLRLPNATLRRHGRGQGLSGRADRRRMDRAASERKHGSLGRRRRDYRHRRRLGRSCAQFNLPGFRECQRIAARRAARLVQGVVVRRPELAAAQRNCADEPARCRAQCPCRGPRVGNCSRTGFPMRRCSICNFTRRNDCCDWLPMAAASSRSPFESTAHWPARARATNRRASARRWRASARGPRRHRACR